MTNENTFNGFQQSPFAQPAAQGFGQPAQQAFGQPAAPVAPQQAFGQPVAPVAPAAPQQAQAFTQPAPAAAPNFASAGAPTGRDVYVTGDALALGWITPEQDAQFKQFENNHAAIASQMAKSYQVNATGIVTFSTLGNLFLPKEDKGYGREWTMSLTLKDVHVAPGTDPFAAYVFAKRLRINTTTNEATYSYRRTIQNADETVTRDQAKEMARNNTTQAGKPAPFYPVLMIDEKDMSRSEPLVKDFVTDGTQKVTMSLNLAFSQTPRAQMSQYLWYKPWFNGLYVDLDNVKYNEYNSNPFMAAQKHVLAEYDQQQAGVAYAQPAAPVAPVTPVAPQGFVQPTAPVNTFEQQTPVAPAAPVNPFEQQAAPAPAQAAPANPFQQQAPAVPVNPFAAPFGNANSGNPFA